MNARIKTMIAVTALLLQAGVAWAGSETRLGTSGASEMRLLVGARTVGMFGSNTGMVTGAEALFYNPAGLAAAERPTEVMFSYASYIADMKLNYVAVAQKMGDLGSVGFSAKVLTVGDMDFTSETAPDGTGETFSPTFGVLGFTYAKQITDRVNFGGTMSYVTERVLQTSATGLAFDFGFQYDTGYHGVHLGAAMKNYGSPQSFSGADFEKNQILTTDNPQAAPHTLSLGSAEYELPSLFAGALSMPLTRGINNFTVHALYQSNSFDVDEFRFGAEYEYRSDLALRVGYKYTSNEDNLYGLAYGVGVRVPLGGSFMRVDYAGQQVSDFFDDVQHVGVTFVF